MVKPLREERLLFVDKLEAPLGKVRVSPLEGMPAPPQLAIRFQLPLVVPVHVRLWIMIQLVLLPALMELAAVMAVALVLSESSTFT